MIFLPFLCDLGNTLVLSAEISRLPAWAEYLWGERRPRAYLGSCRLMWESWGLELHHNESRAKCFCGLQSHSSDFVEPAKSQVWNSWENILFVKYLRSQSGGEDDEEKEKVEWEVPGRSEASPVLPDSDENPLAGARPHSDILELRLLHPNVKLRPNLPATEMCRPVQPKIILQFA